MEQWIWGEHMFARTLMNPHFDYKDSYMTWLIESLFVKLARLFSAIFGFMLLSFVNGMIVRIALMCSNVVIFPLIYFMECFAANQMSNA
mmetsp:Transcript_36222/g.47581  ORF Transcript_36222/g.47581 Transcript_36222/m.47581 type:complete len:89 (-) Transcript_36222:1024-1290(-)